MRTRSPFGPFADRPFAARNAAHGKPGAKDASFASRHRVVGLVGVTALDCRPLIPGDLGFECEHGVGARGGVLGVVITGQRQRRAQVFAIRVARRRERGVVFQVVVAVRHAEAGLRDGRHVVGRVLGVGGDGNGERAFDRHGGIPHRARDVVRRLKRSDRGEIFLRRRQAILFDRAGVGIRVVEIANLPFFGVRLRLRLEPLHDRCHALFAENRQVRKRAGRRPIGRDDGVLVPGPVGVVEEVVTGLDALVHAGEVHAPGAEGGLLCRLCVSQKR